MLAKVTIYGKENCCLCDHAKDLIVKLARDIPLQIEEVDIKADRRLWEAFHECIPVVALNGRIVFRGKVAELWLRRELAKLGG